MNDEDNMIQLIVCKDMQIYFNLIQGFRDCMYVMNLFLFFYDIYDIEYIL